MEIIRRKIYLNHIISLINKGIMLVLVGPRRVGKSCVLLDLKRWLEENEPNSNVMYLDKDQRVGESVMNSDDLYSMVNERLCAGTKNYLLIDEVQNIENYDIALRNIYSENLCQIVVTGSNAYIYSSELGTRLGGRHVEIPIYSLTYLEFLDFHRLQNNNDSLNAYLKAGGLPGLCHFDINDTRQLRDYMQGVYNTIMMRDIVERVQIRNTAFLTNLSLYVADTMGKPVTPNNITKKMNSQGEKITNILTSSYLNYLTNSLLLTPVYRYDIHGKKLFEQNVKYYFSDHGLRNFLCGFKVRASIERIIESVIWHHLRVQDFNVTVGVLRAGEVDFVAEKDEKRIYIQAAYLLASQETIDREFGNLKAIKDGYPKYVVSMDPISGEVEGYPGIMHVHLRDFLSMQF